MFQVVRRKAWERDGWKERGVKIKLRVKERRKWLEQE